MRRGSCPTVAFSVVLIIAVLLVGCEAGKQSARGFRLPDGNPDDGEDVFIAKRCHSCHMISGHGLPEPEERYGVPIILGGEVLKVRTYGELVTAIIHPSHTLAGGYDKEIISKEGRSLMPNFNDHLAVAQLIDLVAFLQAQYRIKPAEHLYYPY